MGSYMAAARNRMKSVRKRIMFIGRLIFIFIILFCIGYLRSPAHGDDQLEIDRAGEDLERVRMEIEDKRSRLQSLLQNEKSVLSNIRTIEENIDLTNAFIRKLNGTSAGLQKNIERLTETIDSVSIELDIARSYFYKHMTVIYKRNLGRSRIAYLLSGSLPDAVRKYHLSRSLIDYDNRLVETIRNLMAEIEQKRAEVQNNQRELEQVRVLRNKGKSVLNREKGLRQAFLSRVRNERKLQKEAIAQLEREALELERIIEDLRTAETSEEELVPDRETSFYRFRRQLSWPVKGKVSLGYGDVVHPVYMTRTFNPGIDISAPYGNVVTAVADGTVAYVGYLRGYGNFVVVDHGESYYSLYSRLSEINVEEDQVVLKGDSLARVGDAGEGGSPSLHFEIRRGKKTYNPLEWLK